jgi:hypothetical protein
MEFDTHSFAQAVPARVPAHLPPAQASIAELDHHLTLTQFVTADRQFWEGVL